MDLNQIQTLTEDYAVQHARLVDVIAEYHDGLEKLTRRFGPIVKDILADVTSAHTTLQAAIKGNPELFKSPRTYVFDDVKVGLQSKKGKTTIADADDTLKKLLGLFSEEDCLTLGYLTKKLVLDKDGLAKLGGVELKKIGVQITGDTDAVVIKPVNEVEKIVETLLKASAPEEMKGAA